MSTLLFNITVATLTTLDEHHDELETHGHHDHSHDHHWEDRSQAEIGIEVFFLALIAIVGTFGNLILILSIVILKRVHKNGNIFLVNLAAADMLVSCVCVPIVAANAALGMNVLPEIGCTIMGYLTIVCWANSLSNLAFIAANRYWAVVHYESHSRYFSKKRTIAMVLVTWLWANLLIMPVLTGWSKLEFDAKMMMCSWHDTETPAFNACMMVAVFIPVIIIIVCYWRLVHSVRKRGKWVRSISQTCSAQSQGTNKKTVRKEVDLMKTLGVTVAVFLLFWLPYGLMLSINPEQIPAIGEKIIAWLALSSSSVNFIIYGVMNPVYRRGYVKLWNRVRHCTCKRFKADNDSSSTFSVKQTKRMSTASQAHRKVSRLSTPQLNFGFNSGVSSKDFSDDRQCKSVA
uniref:5-hydroxytryptamine receptor-like n=1 Tax=Phallusia mammillata TaxID=59560 RepID=A0A6F9DFD9_9ASCI|nr:5-hydroxytryptamine receptor-like [Phallusia mammillata]